MNNQFFTVGTSVVVLRRIFEKSNEFLGMFIRWTIVQIFSNGHGQRTFN